MISELGRLEGIKQTKLKEIIEERFFQMLELRKELGLQPEEFPLIISEQTFNMIEEEIFQLEKQLTLVKPIIDIIKRKKELIQEKALLEESSMDPSRLLSRGGGSGVRLLKEEKQRQKIQKELPKVEAQLCRMLQEYQQINQKAFEYQGIKYPQQVENTISQHSQPKILNSTNIKPKKCPYQKLHH